MSEPSPGDKVDRKCSTSAYFPLVVEKIEFRRLGTEVGENAMGLAAVMGLVVEEMRERRCQLLFDRIGQRDRLVADGAGELRLVEAAHIAEDTLVLGLARRA